jgi:hypothetical protein
MFLIRNGVKQGDALSPLIFSFVVENVIRRVRVNHDVLKLNGTHQLLFYADDVNILEGSVILKGNHKVSVHLILYCNHQVHRDFLITLYKEKRRSLVVASKKNGLKVNADKTKYMLVSRDQNAGRSHNI